MLTSVGDLCSPAVDRHRRRAFFVVFAVATFFVSAHCGCFPAPPPPADAWDGFRAVLQRSVRELRQGDSAGADLVERLLSDAERAAASERSALPWRRDPGRRAAAWSGAVVTAERLISELRAERAKQRIRVEGLLAEVEPRLESAAARIGRSGVSSREIGQIVSGRHHIATARALAERGDFLAALDHAESAVSLALDVDAAWQANTERLRDPALLGLWRALAEETIEDSRRGRGPAVVIDKSARRLHLYRSGRHEASFGAEFGANGLDRKLYSGDRATPEGRYRITVKKNGGATRFYLALLIDYPNAKDRRRFEHAVASGAIPRSTGIGGLIEIHGFGGEGRDWTDGCVALTNEDMDRLFPQVVVGTPVTIVGAL
jgi:lipoprotein-anchoring transpeptidase ErfK/SrfK